MTVDLALLQDHRSYQDARIGIAEAFLQPRLGGDRTVAVLSRPLAAARTTGWLICHAFASEQMHLSRLETRVARALAATGFPVLRYQGQGYADSMRSMDGISLGSHLSEAEHALDLLVEQTGVERVATLGARFGGTVAALIADRANLAGLVTVEPVIRGGQYMRDFIRTEVFSGMTGGVDFDWGPPSGNGRGPGPPEGQDGHVARVGELREELASRGWTDIKGFQLSRAAYEEISGVNLLTDVTRFAGRSLVVSITRSGHPSPGAQALGEHLGALGGDPAIETIPTRLAAQFGQYHYAPSADRSGEKSDTQFELTGTVAATTAGWADRAMRAEGDAP
jgi:pimeloyl-ACP methyl ester carboxylesterase